MPNTITTYNTFVASTRAKSQQVNENFNNYRGDLIPINIDTATSSTLVHDLGQSDHRWNSGYIKKIILGSTSTSWSIEESTTTGDAISFKHNSVEKFKVHDNSFFVTMSGVIASANTSGTWFVSGSTITVAITDNTNYIEAGTVSNNNGGRSLITASTTAQYINSYVSILIDGATVAGAGFEHYSTTNTGGVHIGIPVSSFRVLFNGVTAGSRNFSLSIHPISSGQTFRLSNLKMYVRGIG